MFCIKCGNMLVEGALFCSKCGERVYSVESAPSESPDGEEVVAVEEANDGESVSMDVVQQHEVIAAAEGAGSREEAGSLKEINSEVSVPTEEVNDTAAKGEALSEEDAAREREIYSDDGTAENNINMMLITEGNIKVPVLLKQNIGWNEAEKMKADFESEGVEVTFTDQDAYNEKAETHGGACEETMEEDGTRESEGSSDGGTAEKNISVTLKSVGNEKVKIIKLVREWTGMDLKESKELVEKVPVLLKQNISLEEAEKIKTAFECNGAEVSLINQDAYNEKVEAHGGSCEKTVEDGDNSSGVTSSDKKNSIQRNYINYEDDISREEVFKEIKGLLKVATDRFKALTTGKQTAVVIAILVVFIIAAELFIALFRWTFSSLFAMIAVVAGGYFIYYKWIANLVVEFIYSMRSQRLQLPEGMSAKTLLESLGGKLNYPYFKGVRYGEKGECIIEGKYSVYPVVFNEENMAGLTYDNADKGEPRLIMLEAMALRNYINKFFNPTLPIDVMKDLKKLKAAEGQRRVAKAASIAASVSVFIVIFAGAAETTIPGSVSGLFRPGIEVRSAYLTQYSSAVTIEEAFDNFFDNGSWSKYEEAGYTYIVFTGTCEYMGDRTDIRITFKITGEKFIVDKMEADGREQNSFMLALLLTKIYENY